MNLQANWAQILATVDASIRSSKHCAIASVGADGAPHITPIGFVFLRDDCTGYYFERHVERLCENLDRNPRVCLLFVNSQTSFWGSFLIRGRFNSPPGVRLMGVAGQRRHATDVELERLRRRIGFVRRTAGAGLIWNGLEHVRDIAFERFEPVRYPGVTEHLWR